MKLEGKVLIAQGGGPTAVITNLWSELSWKRGNTHR